MLVVYKGRPVEIDWYIYRGCNKQTEDFTQVADGDLKAFVVGGEGTSTCPVSIDRDEQNKQFLRIGIDTSRLKQGVYDAKVIWYKNRQGGRCLSRHMDSRSHVMLSGVFAVTILRSEDNTRLDSGQTAVKVLRSLVESYGYDGLSAYEIAVFHGFEGTEEEWISEIGKTRECVSIEKVAPFLYKTEYDTIEYDYAKAHIDDVDPSVGACSAIYSNGIVGRNFDWLYDYQAAFFVKTHNSQGRYAVSGIAGMKQLTIQKVDSREYTNAYRMLPFMLQDGRNEKGLFAEMNVVPSHGNTHTTPLVEKRETISALMLVRYILDYFGGVNDAVDYIKNYVEVTMPAKLTAIGYELHYLLADADGTCKVLEIVNNSIVTIDSNISTNFLLSGITILEDGSVYTNKDVPTHLPTSIGVETYGSGLERWNILNSANVTDAEGMRDAIDSVKYSKAYMNAVGVDFWYSEFVGGAITVDTPTDNIQFITRINEYKQKWHERSRQTAEVWITTHSCVYDLASGKIEVKVQEESGSYIFGVDSSGSGTSDYNDLSNKPSINSVTLSGNKTAADLGLASETELTELASEFVSKLTNYYLKSQTYTKDEVNAIVDTISGFDYIIVSNLPTATEDTMHRIYLVPSEDPVTDNVKDEFITIYSEGIYSWEKIGSTSVDLSGYSTTTEMNAAISNALSSYMTTTDITSILTGYATRQYVDDAVQVLDSELSEQSQSLEELEEAVQNIEESMPNVTLEGDTITVGSESINLKEVVVGFLNNGTFYSDSSYESPIIGSMRCVYIDVISNAMYRYDGASSYIPMSSQPFSGGAYDSSTNELTLTFSGGSVTIPVDGLIPQFSAGKGISVTGGVISQNYLVVSDTEIQDYLDHGIEDGVIRYVYEEEQS